MDKHTNRLIKETSPYLLQHAHNPVDWYPWGDEALSKAKQEDKPVLVSIGYAACHWCHVMERESFEDEETAAIMNENFINIKIDREERPDLDHIYMDAVQAMTGSGGWPLNIFLTSDGRPFYGGTYFPPNAAYNRPSWRDVLFGVRKAFKEKRTEINEQAENLTEHLRKSNDFGLNLINGASEVETVFKKSGQDLIFLNIMQVADKEEGGFGKAPKFPQTFTIQYLLHYYYHTKKDEALAQALLSLDKMIFGGIYDQVGGGFARYSTDREWLVPHFEKMLYDNALLVSVMSEAGQLTGKKHYLRTVTHTLEFIEREFLSPQFGFYSALDADSEGVEGKYYVWDKQEVLDILGEEKGILIAEFFDITETGNWEHKNILRVKNPPEAFAKKKGIPLNDLLSEIEEAKGLLLEARAKRVPPSLDDKILLGWNALMNSALSKAYAFTGNRRYLELATSNMDFLLKNFRDQEGAFFHTWKEGAAKFPAFLDDYAFLIQALIQLQEITADPIYLNNAREIADFVIRQFSEEASGFFFFTNANQTDVILRKKEIYDGAVPSGNSIMALNLYYLGTVFDRADWRNRAAKLCGGMQNVLTKYPTSFGVWAILSQSFTHGIPEIAILGKSFRRVHEEFLRIFIPLKIFQSAPQSTPEFPLLRDKPDSDLPKLYLCKQYACQNPVSKVEELVQLLEFE